MVVLRPRRPRRGRRAERGRTCAEWPFAHRPEQTGLSSPTEDTQQDQEQKLCGKNSDWSERGR
jgi:hypothetical protein